MAPVKLSSKYQVVIPPDVRREFRLTPGQRLEVVIYEGRITLVPLGPMKALRGLARGIDTRVKRDADRV
jgi:AbrB family looped-hinge helix DNA binding protein